MKPILLPDFPYETNPPAGSSLLRPALGGSPLWDPPLPEARSVTPFRDLTLLVLPQPLHHLPHGRRGIKIRRHQLHRRDFHVEFIL